jgi:organic hydroperoxide reductase OsmC/OhrA
VKVSAQVQNAYGEHQAVISTNGNTRSISIPPKMTGLGSSASGGELLFLALATCYCNDIYREADKRGIRVERVEVEVNGDFGGPGDGATNVIFRSKVTADAPEAEIEELMRYTDTVSEIQNTLRAHTPVTLTSIEAVSKPG